MTPGVVILWFCLDFLVITPGISALTAWFWVSRRDAKRTPDHLGKGDVKLLHQMASLLTVIQERDHIVPLGMGQRIDTQIRDTLDRYNKTQETT